MIIRYLKWRSDAVFTHYPNRWIRKRTLPVFNPSSCVLFMIVLQVSFEEILTAFGGS